ncbi:MAG TPA: alternative ribosome rescue aminoacyl-tRNA hydrolase ArfB [Gemmatimonadales bacterium]|nr:alternative ribosome rescue aminoacyl-tRNA hydrolase ArfB [Gemmatimonadales bacterium]
MPATAWLSAGHRLQIPRAEVSYRATRAGGPGGQHVNTSSTRVELWWNLRASSALSDPQRTLLEARLGHRMDQDGWIRLVESGSRSQLRNKETVTERFLALVAEALRPPKVRKPTRVSRTQKAKRLETKRQRADVKRLRGKVRGDE